MKKTNLFVGLDVDAKTTSSIIKDSEGNLVRVLQVETSRARFSKNNSQLFLKLYAVDIIVLN